MSVQKLFFSVIVNDLADVKRQIEAGISVDVVDNQYSRCSVLHMSTCKGYKDIVVYLLSHGANPSVQDDQGYTPLHLAIIYAKMSRNKIKRDNFLDIAKYLINYGAHLEIKSEYGTTPIDKAKEPPEIYNLLTEILGYDPTMTLSKLHRSRENKEKLSFYEYLQSIFVSRDYIPLTQ